MLPPELTALLAPDEQVLWSTQPRPAVYILRGLPNLAYGVTWGVLGAFWYRGSGGISEATSAFEGWWRVLPLFSIPFILAGLSFFLYPIRLGRRAHRTWYVVTNRRAFVAELSSSKPPQIHVFSQEDLAAPEIRKRWDGLHDLILSHHARENPHLQPRLTAGFLGLMDVEWALEALRTSAKAA